MPPIDLPFQPIRNSLYSPGDFFSGFDRTDPRSYAATPDFKIFVRFVLEGRASPRDPFMSMMESLHDHSITQATLQMLSGQPRIAAVMGGHEEQRGSAAYSEIARISQSLTEKGFLMASGGGPGAMEASHLGALLTGHPPVTLENAIAKLKSQPVLPSAAKVVAPNGDIDYKIVEQLHAWFLPAMEVLAQYGHDQGSSLAVPTWFYGHEPTTPFATHIAKYFQNSLREDGLITLATHGIVYAPGKAGTLQEVFQDAAQNYYHSVGDRFSPMVFLDKVYWSRDLPAEALLRDLFVKNGKKQEYESFVLFTDDAEEAVKFIEANAPPEFHQGVRWRALGIC